jgi:hypothetical protein
MKTGTSTSTNSCATHSHQFFASESLFCTFNVALCIDNVLDLCRERARANYPHIGVGAISKKSTKYTSGKDKRRSVEGVCRFNILMNAVGVD